MKKIEVSLPDSVVERFEKLFAEQGGSSYVSVNTNDVSGRDALFTDLLILGLDELAAGEDQFPDDVD